MKLEKQVILAYKKRGQAKYNRQYVSEMWSVIPNMIIGATRIVSEKLARDACSIAIWLNYTISKRQIGSGLYEIHRIK